MGMGRPSMSELLELFDRPIAFHRVLVTITGSVNAALMLSQAIYWSRRTRDPQRWFYKTIEAWEAETGLTRREQETARKKLKPWLQTALRGVPATLHFRVNESSLAESAKLVWQKAPSLLGGNEQTISETIKGITKPPKGPAADGLFEKEQRKRLGAIFNRRESTRWSEKEEKAFKTICPIDNEELWLVERYYRAERLKPDDKNYSRRDLQTLLNNWPSEVDRARVWKNRRTAKQRKEPAPAPGDLATPDDFVRAGPEAKRQLEELRARLYPKGQPCETDGAV
jgi:hypothetical protein